jgi:hypothetical protein
MTAVCENRVISIKVMKRLGSTTYMLQPRSSVLEVLYQYGSEWNLFALNMQFKA